MWRFAKAVLLGALAAAGPPMLLFTIPVAGFMVPSVARGDEDLWRAAYLAFLPLLVALPVVLVAALLVGLPATAFLKWRGQESRHAYVMIGVVSGAVIPMAVLATVRVPTGYWIGLLGALAGGVAAQVWWSSAPASKVR